ncbi:hypothetical protein DMENIID0001_049030 [Sergentomyia squamirostris]
MHVFQTSEQKYRDYDLWKILMDAQEDHWCIKLEVHLEADIGGSSINHQSRNESIISPYHEINEDHMEIMPKKKWCQADSSVGACQL